MKYIFSIVLIFSLFLAEAQETTPVKSNSESKTKEEGVIPTNSFKNAKELPKAERHVDVYRYKSIRMNGKDKKITAEEARKIENSLKEILLHPIMS